MGDDFPQQASGSKLEDAPVRTKSEGGKKTNIKPKGDLSFILRVQEFSLCDDNSLHP